VNDQIDFEILGRQDGIFRPPLRGTHAGDFAWNAEAVRNQAGHHVHGIIVGNGDEIIHLPGTGFPPAFHAHGIALHQAGI